MVDANLPDESRRPRHGQSRLRNIALGMLLGLLVGLAGTVVLLATLLGGRLPAISMDDYRSALARWTQTAPQNYDLDLELSGINPGTAHVEVRGGEVVAMTHNGRPTRPHLWDDWTVPGLLSIIRRDLEACMAPGASAASDASPNPPPNREPAAALQDVVPRGEFDPHYGYPARYHRVTPTGADAKWQVTKFEPK